jgi:hypothetical protein
MVLLSNFAGSPPNSASLSSSQASEIVCGRFFARLVSLSRNGLMLDCVIGGCSSPCGKAVLTTFSCAKVRLNTGCMLDIVEGTKVALGWLKKVRRDPFFLVFMFLSCLAFVCRSWSLGVVFRGLQAQPYHNVFGHHNQDIQHIPLDRGPAGCSLPLISNR